ncbi:MAG: hypothetical protein Q9182_006139 [Xanthomendoza sp. 2 TL-2023]
MALNPATGGIGSAEQQIFKSPSGASLVNNFHGVLVQSCTVLSESRFFEVAKHCRLIRAGESGRNDLGISITPNAVLGDTTADKFFALGRNHTGCPVVIPGDLKTYSPIHDSNGNVVWHFQLSRDQCRTSQFIILMSFQEPAYVALIPMTYISQRLKRSPAGGKMEQRPAAFQVEHQRGREENSVARREGTVTIQDHCRPLWTLHPIAGFAPELAPFMLPLARLDQALENIYQYTIGAAKEWINEHTGASYTVPRPVVYNPSVLEPSQPTKTTVHTQLVHFHRAFQNCSTTFRVEFVDVLPLLADFKLVDLRDGTQIFVEAKLGQCAFVLGNKKSSNYMYHMQYTQTTANEGRLVFTWKVQWDFLYTEFGHQALFIPRDMIPSTFWQERTNAKVWWPEDTLDSLRSFVVNQSSASQMVADMERILSTLKSRKFTVKALEEIPVTPYYDEPLNELLFDSSEPEVPSLSDLLPRHVMSPGGVLPQQNDIFPLADVVPSGRFGHGWNSKHYRRGFGSPHHPQLRGSTYESWASEALMELCRKCWNLKDKSRRDRYGELPLGRGLHLHRRTPVVRVSFMRLYWKCYNNPQAPVGAKYILRRIAQRKPSLVICDMFNYSSIRIPHARFIIPSSQLPSMLKSTFVEMILDQRSWDGYRVDDDQVIDVVTSILDGKPQTRIGESIVSCRDYSCYLEDAMKQGVIPWAKKIDDGLDSDA